MIKLKDLLNDAVRLKSLTNLLSDNPMDKIVTDTSGKPKIFYHGTSKKITADDLESGKGSSHPALGDIEGDLYFTDDKMAASYYGHTILTVHLRGKYGYNIKLKHENLSVFDYVDYPYITYIVSNINQVVPIKTEQLPDDWKSLLELPDGQKYYDDYERNNKKLNKLYTLYQKLGKYD